ncbi:MAG: hypothetical protein IJ875_00730 [Solobacterium sp.]|nr:hypothetical protein [Solobacterium sp.]
MQRVLRFNASLEDFKTIILLHKNENGETHIAYTASNPDNEKEHKNCIVLYKAALPKGLDYLAAWNQLDDSSEKIYLDFNERIEVAIDDFLAAHATGKTWTDLEYYVLEGTSELNEQLADLVLANNEVRAYAINE